MYTYISETILFYINSYNKFINYINIENTYNKYNLELHNTFFVLNNNNKWYCLLMLYGSENYLFFYDNKGTSFYIETPKFTTIECLVEGYMYIEDVGIIQKNNFMITDILGLNGVIVNKPYSQRYKLLDETFVPLLSFLQDLNCKFNISIHKVYNNDYKQFLSDNDKYIETIDDYIKKNSTKLINYKVPDKKLITSTNNPDVYKVSNLETNVKEGILYIKTIGDSKRLLNRFLDCHQAILQCVFNTKFNRWEAEDFLPIKLNK